MKNKRGFSLVELLAVIILLGVILLIAVPSYNKYIEKTNASKCETDKAAIIDATKSFITDCIYKNRCATSTQTDTKIISNYIGTSLKVENLINTKFISKEFEKYKELAIRIDKKDIDGISDYEVSIANDKFNNLCK